MKFEINGRKWEIKEIDKEVLLEEYKKEYDNASYIFGLTKYSNQTIYINNELCQEQKKQTLLHELMHCYIWCYMHSFDNVSEEAMCDISANSHYIIHTIVEDYFKENKKHF